MATHPYRIPPGPAAGDGRARPVQHLTVRGVKAMLTRHGVDYSALAIVHDPAVWTDVETGQRATSVVISGPREPRYEAYDALLDAGLACAGYPDRDCWSRRAGR